MTDNLEEHFKTLDLSPGASPLEIKKQFRDLAFRYHPDRNPHDPNAANQFKMIASAYAFLMGNQEVYQALRYADENTLATQAKEFKDIFAFLFDESIVETSFQKLSDFFCVPLYLNPKQLSSGGTQSIRIERRILCADCDGQGTEKGGSKMTCKYCMGFGDIETKGKRKPCRQCSGVGFLSSSACLSCSALGYQLESIALKFEIPALTEPEAIFEIPDQGHVIILGGQEKKGSIFIKVLKKGNRFPFDEQTLICEVREAQSRGQCKILNIQPANSIWDTVKQIFFKESSQ